MKQVDGGGNPGVGNAMDKAAFEQFGLDKRQFESLRLDHKQLHGMAGAGHGLGGKNLGGEK